MKAHPISYLNADDETLCALAAADDRQAEEMLVLRYTRLVRACARPYFLAGGDSEDLIQEGMVGLIKAIREYDAEKAASFKTYAEICIRSRLYSAIKTAARVKHSPLNNYISFEAPLFDGSENPLAYETVHFKQKTPEELIIGKEEFRELLGVLHGHLSGFEAKVLQLYLNGLSYAEIAAETEKPLKSVDNAVQRMRRKVARYLNPGDFSKS